jgi:hypothetical protein
MYSYFGLFLSQKSFSEIGLTFRFHFYCIVKALFHTFSSKLMADNRSPAEGGNKWATIFQLFSSNSRSSSVRESQSGWPDWENFRLLGDCLCTSGSFFENWVQNCPNYWADYFHGKIRVLILTWNGLGDFFTDASGHPDHCHETVVKLFFLPTYIRGAVIPFPTNIYCT